MRWDEVFSLFFYDAHVEEERQLLSFEKKFADKKQLFSRMYYGGNNGRRNERPKEKKEILRHKNIREMVSYDRVFELGAEKMSGSVCVID